VAEERGRGRGRPAAPAGPPRGGSGTGRGRAREPRLIRSPSRAGSVVKATTELLGLSSTRRAAVLALVVCALALTVSVPLRNYAVQRQELAAVTAQQQALAAEVEELTRERERLSDPAEIAAQARSRLGFVAPGEVPYVVQLPSTAEAEVAPDPEAGTPWYQRLWREVAETNPAEPVQ
jgi:cell division protein FtsB